MGEKKKGALRLGFDREVKLEFHGANRYTSAVGCMAPRLWAWLEARNVVRREISANVRRISMGQRAPIRLGIVGLGRAGWQCHCRELEDRKRRRLREERMKRENEEKLRR